MDEPEDKAIAKGGRPRRAYRPAWVGAMHKKNQHKTITSSTSRTIRHLYAVRGLIGIFRGARVMFIWSFARYIIGLLVNYALVGIGLRPVSYLAQATRDFISTLLLSPLSLAWNHLAISRDIGSSPSLSQIRPTSSSRSLHSSTLFDYIRRVGGPSMPSEAALKAQLIPCAITGALQAVYHLFPLTIFFSLVRRTHETKDGESVLQAITLHSLWRFFVLEWFLLQIGAFILYQAAAISLVRVQASLLPENLKPVIPTDRTLRVGLAATKQIAREDKSRMLLDAWRSTTWDTFWRFIRSNYIKRLVIYMVSSLFFGSLLKTSGRFVDGYRVETRSWYGSPLERP